MDGDPIVGMNTPEFLPLLMVRIFRSRNGVNRGSVAQALRWKLPAGCAAEPFLTQIPTLMMSVQLFQR